MPVAQAGVASRMPFVVGDDMTNDALIDNKVVTLTDKEVKDAANFHKKRLPFIYINNKLVFNTNFEDDRDHQHWVLEDFGIGIKEFETLNRGYMLPGRIQFFKGSTFGKIDTSQVSIADIRRICEVYKTYIGAGHVVVYNGVHVGRVGEVWEPMETLLEIEL